MCIAILLTVITLVETIKIVIRLLPRGSDETGVDLLGVGSIPVVMLLSRPL